MNDTPQWRIEWLHRHIGADVIVCDETTGQPIRAEYRPNGRYPVAYLYPSDEAINL